MSVAVRRLLVSVVFLSVLPSAAVAAPSATCASKFVGTWSVTINDSDQAYTREITADGRTTILACPFCVPQNWTCNGNTFTLHGARSETRTLSPDGRRMTGSGRVETRIGGPAPAVAAIPESKEPGAPKVAASPGVSCSNIAGSTNITRGKGTTPAATHCRNGNSALYAARAARGPDSAHSAEQYKKAAEAYRRAGDNALADAVLKEAGALLAAAPSLPREDPRRLASGASQPTLGDQPSRSSPRPLWSGSREECDSAGVAERQTASWYNACVDPAVDLAKRAKYRGQPHQPSIDPQKLLVRARDVCRTSPADAMPRCIMEIKVNIVLAEDAAIRADCASRDGGDHLVACVHQAYLYGSGGVPAAFEEKIRRLPGNTSSVATAGSGGPLVDDGRCQPGYGMKPAPGAAGAWSCQPAGARAGLAAHAAATSAAATADPVQAFERRINDIAATAVVMVADAAGEQLAGADRELCRAAAFAAVRSVLKGGAPPVPEKCRPMANAARAELAYYAVARIDTRSNPAVEDLLSALAERSR